MQESNNWKTEITYGIEVTASEFIIYIKFLRQLHGAGTSHCSQRNADTTSSKISQRNLARKPKNIGTQIIIISHTKEQTRQLQVLWKPEIKILSVKFCWSVGRQRSWAWKELLTLKRNEELLALEEEWVRDREIDCEDACKGWSFWLR